MDRMYVYNSQKDIFKIIGGTMQDKIGEAAGQVWSVLAKSKTPVNVSDLPKLANLKTHLAYQGLGWLAREGKVAYQTKGQKTTVSLCHAECVC